MKASEVQDHNIETRVHEKYDGRPGRVFHNWGYTVKWEYAVGEE